MEGMSEIFSQQPQNSENKSRAQGRKIKVYGKIVQISDIMQFQEIPGGDMIMKIGKKSDFLAFTYLVP